MDVGSVSMDFGLVLMDLGLVENDFNEFYKPNLSINLSKYGKFKNT